MQKMVVVIACQETDATKKIVAIYPDYVSAVMTTYRDNEKTTLFDQTLHKYVVNARRSDFSEVFPTIIMRDSGQNNLFIIQQKEMSCQMNQLTSQ